jgi:DNA-directed RNA polymerase specialized sigma24 family protein
MLESKYVKEMSVQEIATQIGRTAKATESLLTRAREAFREAFTLLQAGSLHTVK